MRSSLFPVAFSSSSSSLLLFFIPLFFLNAQHASLNSPYAVIGERAPTGDHADAAHHGWPRWVTILVGLVCAGAAAAITYYATKAGSSTYDVNKPYAAPSAYQAQLQFRIPYLNFTEPIVAHVDSVRGAMRLDYYSGMDVYIFDTQSNVSTSIVPVYTTPTCLVSVQPGLTMQNLFPVLTNFRLQGKQETVTVPIADASQVFLLTS